MEGYVIYNGQLYHHGVKGMKWGVRKKRPTKGVRSRVTNRRAKEEAYRKKLSAISKNLNEWDTDYRYIEARNQKTSTRIAKTATTAVLQTLIPELIGGGFNKYRGMSREQLRWELTKKAATVVGATASSLALQNYLAKSASKRYDDRGKLIPEKKKKRLLSKEEAVEIGVTSAVAAAPWLLQMGAVKMAQVNRRKAADEARFRKWGQNILVEKTDNVIWQSEDLKYAIIDNRGR